MSDSIGLADPCTCGNTNPLEYRLYETKSGDILGKQCILCRREWFPKEHHPDVHEDTTDSSAPASSVNGPKPITELFQRNPFRLDDNTAFQILGARTKIEWNIDLLIPGSHITWQRKWGYWHHAIVVEISDYGMYVIHWTKVHNGQIQITKQFLSIDQMMENDPDSLYRLDYPEEIEKANDMTLVLARAFSRLGDKKYGLLNDNCESFATFCKTGYEKSHQVLWLEDKMREFLGEFGVTTAKTLVKSACKIASSMTEKALQSATKSVAALVSKAAEKAGKKIAETAFQEFTEKLAATVAQMKGKLTEETFRKVWQNVASKTSSAVNTAATEITEEAVQEFMAKSAGKVYVAESVEKISRTSNFIGAGLIFIIEGFLVAKDIYKLYPERKNGNQTRRVFIEETTRRSVEGVSAASFAVAFSLGPEVIGMAIGTSIGPVGTLLGGVAGGAIGYALGKAVGTTAGSHAGRALSKRFQDDRAVNDINDLEPGDHVVLNCGGCLHPRCHGIVVEHDGKNSIKVIRNKYKEGVVEEWINFTQPLYKVAYDEGECKDAQKVILYARLKRYEGHRYSLAKYNCKTFARECKTKAVLI